MPPRATTDASLIRLPLQFEANVGQTDPEQKYLTHTGALQLGFSAQGLSVYLPSSHSGESLRVLYPGASDGAAIAATEKGSGESNYLIGDQPAAWKTHIPQYGRLTYSEIYPGIDLTYYGAGGRLEHDFVVKPGADYHQIKVRYDGARSVRLDASGNLHVSLSSSELLVHAPRIYQNFHGVQQAVSGRFVIGDANEVSFTVGDFDPSQPLVIDPVLDYSTYLANLSIGVAGSAIDAAGSNYITGYTFSTAFPVTAGAFQTTCSSCAANYPSAYVTKLNAAGTAVIYSTYIGGSNYSQPEAIAVDASGDAVIVGYTESTDFPLKNPVASGTASYMDGFITSLAPNGASLNYSSRLGGAASSGSSAPTYPTAVAVDATGNAYVAGTTESSYYPVTPGALDAGTPSGYGNSYVFVSKLSLAGALSYSALVGNIGTASDCCSVAGLVLDATGAAYVAGTTGAAFSPSPFPTTAGAYQSAVPAGFTTAPFVSKLSADGSKLVFSTLAGNGILSGIALTASQQPVLVGTYASGLPVGSASFSTVAGTSFIAKLSADGTQLPYATYFSTSAGDTGSSISKVALDSTGNVWIAGTGGTVPLVHPIQSVPGTSASAFLAEFDPLISTILFSTYYNGPSGATAIDGLTLDPQGRAHIAGTANYDLNTTASAYLPAVTMPPAYYNYTYGFSALIDPSLAGPGICFTYPIEPAVQVGSSGQTSFAISNCGNAPLTVTSVQLSAPLFAFTQANPCVGTLAQGASCTVTATFTPTATGTFSAPVQVVSNAPVTSYTRYLEGYATAPAIELEPSSYTFPTELFGSGSDANAQIFVVNYGTAPLIVYPASSAITGDFSIVSNDCNAPIPTPRSSSYYYACIYTIAFKPVVTGTRTGALTISSNDPVHPTVTLSLSGVSVASYAAPSLTSLSATALPVSTSATTLYVYGSNFYASSVVMVDGVPLPTTFSSNTSLTVTLPATLFAAIGEHSVTVYTPAPGGGETAPLVLTVYQALSSIAPNFLVSTGSTLYASIPASATTYPNTVVPINPANGALGTPIPVGNNPTLLALSSDGNYLYVALAADLTVQRINLQTNAVDRTFALPPSPCSSCSTPAAVDLLAVPGVPTEVVVSQNSQLTLFNDAGLVNTVPSSTLYYFAPSFTSIAFAGSPQTIYALPFTDVQNPFFSQVNLTASGLQYTPITGGNYGGNNTTGATVVSDGTLLYTSAGEVFNPATKAETGTFPVTTYNDTSYPNERNLAVDSGLGEIYVIGEQTVQSSSELVLTAYGKQTLAINGTLALTPINSVIANNLVRWGTNGFAFLDSGVLYTLRSSIASPLDTNPLPALSALSASSVTAGGPAFTLTLTGSNFETASTVSLSGLYLPATFISPSQLTVTVPASAIGSAGTLQVTVSNPGPGGGTSAALTLTVNPVSGPSILFVVPGHTFGDPPFAVAATSNSTGAITYSVVSGPATIQGSTVTLTGAGTVVLQASQAASGIYNAGTQNASFAVVQAAPMLSWFPVTNAGKTGLPLGTGVLDATSSTPGTFAYTATPQAGQPVAVTASSVLGAGLYTLTANFTPTDQADFLPASLTQSFTVVVQHVWVVSSNGMFSALDDGGNAISGTPAAGGGAGIAIDNSGSIWSVNLGGSSLSKISNTGVVLASGITGGGLNAASVIAIDGNGNAWVANSASVSRFGNDGTVLSPATGYTGGAVNTPSGIAIDLSGNVWVANAGSNSVTKILGGAAPTAPLASGVTNTTLGAKP